VLPHDRYTTRTASATKTAPKRASPVSRRRFLGAAGGVAAVGAAALTSPRVAIATPSNPAAGDAIVVVFLRGGADGLSLTPPYDYDSYRQLRPTIAIPPPGDANGALPLTSAGNPNVVFPTGIDGVVGLHPAFAPIHQTLWASGNLAVIPATGMPSSESRTRSHFEAERYWERGTASAAVRSGWLNRVAAAQGVNTPLPVVNKAYQSQDITDGPSKTLTVPDLRNFGIDGFRSRSRGQTVLESLYTGTQGAVDATGADLLSVIDQVEALDATPSASYPNNKLGRDFQQVAIMLRSSIGLHAAAIEFGGWDHHSELGAPGDPAGRFQRRVSELAAGLRSFTDDLATDGTLAETTILVITEFGRTINENGSGGTDHGRATSIMAMGGGIQGGVFGDDYPPVIEDDPTEGDLTVLTDFRKPITEILANRVGIGVGGIFPTYSPPATALGLTR
jgi:uncharacterized protein (DUF1501 family)